MYSSLRHGQRRFFWLLAMSLLAGIAQAQRFVPPNDVTEFSLSVQVEKADNSSRSHLESIQRFVADQQWDEAIEALRRVMENEGDKLMPLDPDPEPGSRAAGFQRFLSVRDYCQLRLAKMANTAPEALSLYRRQVDPLAKRWFEQAIEDRDDQRLEIIAARFLMSSYGDDALFALSESYIEQGLFWRARGVLEQIVPIIEAEQRHQRTILFYPDSDLEVSQIRARLVLASILENSIKRAEWELAQFIELHGDAEGTINGKSGKLADLLNEMLEESRTWQPLAPSDQWPMFSGSPQRDKMAANTIDPALRPIWTVSLRTIPAGGDLMNLCGRRIAEDTDAALSYFPLVSDGRVLLKTGADIADVHAFDLSTGKPLWSDVPSVVHDQRHPGSNDQTSAPSQVGVPRYTMTATNGRLFVKLGPQAFAPLLFAEAEEQPSGFLTALDMAAQRKRLFEIRLEPPDWTLDWSFDGDPIVRDGFIYAVMRRRDNLRMQNHVVCFEIQGNGTKLRWRRLVAIAESPGQGRLPQYSHNMLSMAGNTLFLNTNLGVVAALDAAEGHVQWLNRYPRSEMQANDPDISRRHFHRDLNPCLVHQGNVIVAPSDCDRVFCLDANSGNVKWSTEPQQAVDATHLLGIVGDRLIASGDRLYWLDAETGGIVSQFPQRVQDSLSGYGRGIIAGRQIYWPTHDRIYVFRASEMKQARQPIELSDIGLTGGNLVIADGVLLVATADRLVAMNTYGRPLARSGNN